MYVKAKSTIYLAFLLLYVVYLATRVKRKDEKGKPHILPEKERQKDAYFDWPAKLIEVSP